MKSTLTILLLFCSALLVRNGYAQTPVKTLELTAHMLGELELHDGNTIDIWGFFYTDSILNPEAPNQLPSPVIELEEGDSVHIMMDNSSNLPHTIHLHGTDVGQANDGVPSTSFQIEGYEAGSYRFRATHAGTFLYHCHVETVIHLQMGMYGAIVVRPKENPKTVYGPDSRFTREYLWLGSEIDADWHEGELTNGMQPDYSPNYFLVNGKSHHQIRQDDQTSVAALVGDTVLLRLANMGYGINRYTFPEKMDPVIIGSDGREFETPEESNTIYVYPGERFAVLTKTSSTLKDSVKLEYLSNFRKQLWGINYIPVAFNEIPLNASKPLPEFSYKISGTHIDLYFQNEAYRHVALYDLSGKIIHRNTSRTTEASLQKDQVKQGIYIIRVFERNGYYSKKVLLK